MPDNVVPESLNEQIDRILEAETRRRGQGSGAIEYVPADHPEAAKHSNLAIMQKSLPLFHDMMEAVANDKDEKSRRFIEGLTNDELRFFAVGFRTWMDIFMHFGQLMYAEAVDRNIHGQAIDQDVIVDGYTYRKINTEDTDDA